MEASTTNTFLSDHIIKALCSTLMHSLWQGILLALVTGAIIVFTKKASAAHRYNLLIGALALFALGVTMTFITQLQKQAGNNITAVAYPTGTPAGGTYTSEAHVSNAHPAATMPLAALASGPIAQQSGRTDVTGTVINYFNSHYNIIVLIWFLIICAKSVQMAVGLHSVFHLKRTKVFAAGKDLENRVLELATQLHIRQTIRLLESGIAKVPMVIGHLKPVILIPIGLINSLTTDEVEAILVHELAHIRRRDYLVNLLQSFMEIIFFFNPAVLWISQLIKTERENCCDDLAIAQSRNKESYIRALVSCEEYQAAGPAYVMAFPGSKNTLLDRVKRMVGSGNHSLNVFEKAILTICLVVFGLGISAFTAREHIKKAFKSVVAVIQHDIKAEPASPAKATRDTTVKKQSAAVNPTAALLGHLQKPDMLGIDSGHAASMGALKQLTAKLDSSRDDHTTVQQQLTALAKLDTGHFYKFRAIGRELYREQLVVDTNHVSISLNERELIVNGVRLPEEVHARFYRKFGNNKSSNNYSRNYASTNYASTNNASGNYASSGSGSSYAGNDGVQSGSGNSHADAYATSNYDSSGYAHAEGGYKKANDARQKHWEEQEKKLVADLLHDGLITDPKNVSFSLSKEKLMINGKKQSDDIYKKYKEKYAADMNGTTWNWTYSHHE